jgi:hypothetical protein
MTRVLEETGGTMSFQHVTIFDASPYFIPTVIVSQETKKKFILHRLPQGKVT